MGSRRSEVSSARVTPLEQAEQEVIFSWRDVAVRDRPDLAMLISTQTGLRTSIGAAMKAKRAGMAKGFPDLALLTPRFAKWRPDCRDERWRFGLFIELKRRDAAPSDLKPEQAEWGRRLIAQGYAWRVCKGATEAIEAIEKYLDGEL